MGPLRVYTAKRTCLSLLSSVAHWSLHLHNRNFLHRLVEKPTRTDSKTFRFIIHIMEKKGNSCPKDACRELYKAIVSPAVRAIRSISTHTASPTPPVKAIDTQSKLEFKQTNTMQQDQVHNTLRNNDEAEVVPINFDYSIQPTATEKPKSAATQHNSKTVASNKYPEATVTVGRSSGHGRNIANSNMEPSHVNKQEGKKTGIHIEDKFTDFINRAKMKLRTTSNVGDGCNASGEDHNGSEDHVNASGKDNDAPGKDKFSEYINRAKKKLRTTSSIGVGKYNSFK
ncbi:hypothetical protein K2173_004726 [Erythroxylum novogranatense]|uniref:Uncharacterized protein n=1 Tax=Erythroxylum novogranatense TaxID=1862640 RepID=A0AAV8UBK8_9ROSI|nr:hypothetical protein K2173_004726 [Erythroxylum novogranatense]